MNKMKMWRSLAFAIAISSLTPSYLCAQDSDYKSYYNSAIASYKVKLYPKFYELIKEANELHPYHQGILYQLGIAAALTGHKAEAIESLRKAILIDNTFQLEGLADFNAIKKTPEFIALLKLQKELSKPVGQSDTAFVVKDRSLHVEGIDYDEPSGNFYLGSIHKRKIVRISKGVATDFCPMGFEGMTSVFGLKIDTKRNLLWACSSPTHEMANYDSMARSAVFKFDLTSGKLIEKIVRPKFERDGVYGDLVISKKGDVYVSDGTTNSIFIVNEKTHQLEPWFTNGEFWNIQGITFSDNEKYLFIADYIRGLYRLEIKTKKLISLPGNNDMTLKGIDGLTYYDNSLIAIQNGVTPFRVVQYFLDKEDVAISGSKMIENKNPAFNEPTLGTISKNIFYYIANSQWSGYDAQHNIKPSSALQDIVILKTKLD